MSRTNNPKVKKKDKPVSKDPRPKIGDFPNREAYRQAVLKWRVRNGFAKAPKPKEEKKYVSPRERKFGKDKLKINKEIEKQVDKYVADRKKPINKVKPNVSVKENKKNNEDNKEKVTPKQKLKIKSTTKGGPVKSGVEYAKSKGDDLAGYRRTKDTRITKKLKKAGFTEDRLARLRKKHAEWKAKRKKKKK
tara:strand:- start:1071 stop:1643 length:573 start_codon:yes stop_codon:yes gene_type:complete